MKGECECIFDLLRWCWSCQVSIRSMKGRWEGDRGDGFDGCSGDPGDDDEVNDSSKRKRNKERMTMACRVCPTLESVGEEEMQSAALQQLRIKSGQKRKSTVNGKEKERKRGQEMCLTCLNHSRGRISNWKSLSFKLAALSLYFSIKAASRSNTLEACSCHSLKLNLECLRSQEREELRS